MNQENHNRASIANNNVIDGKQPEQPAAAEWASEQDGFAANAPPLRHGKDSPRLNLSQNLRSGVRIALFRRVSADGFRSTAGDLALLAITDIVLNLTVSFLLVGAGGEFNYSALPSFCFHLPLMLLCGLLAGRLLARPALVTFIPVALISLSIPLELCHGALEGISQLRQMSWLERYLADPHYYRFFWWWTAASALFLVRLARINLSRRIALFLLFTALLVLPLSFIPRGDLWVSGEEKSESEELRLTEEVLAAQSQLLDKQLAALLPGGKTGPELYFVGFAGDATQDVFMRELTAVERLMSERFGAAGRTVTLVNNPRSLSLDDPEYIKGIAPIRAASRPAQN